MDQTKNLLPEIEFGQFNKFWIDLKLIYILNQILSILD